jgi:monovalent cation:H+ antiporter-2, CPA2 family
MEIPLLPDIVIILGLSVAVILLFQRIKLPTILGFLITGIIAGPYVLSLITAEHEVEMLAEIGVILLLFIIGLEFSLKSLAQIKRAVLLGGTLQVGGTILLVTIIVVSFGRSLPEGIFFGFLFSLSSTAIVLKLLQENGEINSPHGKVALAILIFQDIIVVPMMLFTPLIAGEAENIWFSLLGLAVKGVLIIAFVIVSARKLVPELLYLVVKTKSQEIFILTIVVICFAVAWLTSTIGLSLALGAFLAGLIISESEYSHQATSNILPFREIFTSFFFVSIGMLLDVSFLWEHLGIILILVLATFLLKGAIASLATLILGYTPRTVVLAGLSLFQVGEFAFILSLSGIQAQILDPTLYQYFLSVSILTMAITPFVFRFAHPLANSFVKAYLPKKIFDRIKTTKADKKNIPTEAHNLEGHIIIIGFGINGHNLAKAAKEAHIPYLIIELNAETVLNEKQKGEPILYGDAVHQNILVHANIHKAKVAVIAISDPVATKRIIASIRSITHKVFLIVRTRFVNEMDENIKLGADEVIPEEFETSIEIFTRVLSKYLVPKKEIEKFTKSIRSANYEMLRGIPKERNINTLEVAIPEIEIASLQVEQSNKHLVGKKLENSDIRGTFGITIVAIKRDGEIIADINKDTIILQEDILYVFGKSEDVAKFHEEIRI